MAEEPTAPAIRLRGLTKSFGSVRAVDALDLDIMPGEFFSMLGPSGSGKTTVLRLIAGFEQPTGGTIELFGDDVTRRAPFDRDVNTVFQDYALFPHMSVIDNVAYGLRVRGVARAERRRRALEALASVRLEEFAERKPAQLSGGQRQRVALARATIIQPAALLLDEPLGALDLKLRQGMQVELKEMQRRLGITFVFVTHDQEEALTLSDRIAVMSRGKALQIESATRLYEAPNCREVAEFIGSMNFFQGTLRNAGGGRAVVDAGPLGSLNAMLEGAAPPVGTAVSIAVRPEKLRLAWEQPASHANAVAGRVDAQAYLGDRSHYYIAVPGSDRPIAVAYQNVDRSLDGIEAIGRPVWLTFPAEAAVLLTR